MRFLQRFIAHFFSLIIALSLLLCVSLPVLALSKYKITVDGATISFEAPDNFIGYTKDDMDKNANEFAAFPISKNEAINKIEAGTIINLFSASEKREIELSVVDSDNLSKYSTLLGIGIFKTVSSYKLLFPKDLIMKSYRIEQNNDETNNK